MKLDIWLARVVDNLSRNSIGTARLDALILLEDITGKDRSWLLAHPEFEISADQESELIKLLKRRARHEPLAYIRGKAEFYGRDFVITPTVLVPRPESETMIDLLKSLPDLPPEPRIVDIGTGSGALGITAALELPKAQVELLDIDPSALETAKTNVDKFTLSMRVMQKNLLQGVSTRYDAALCNLPYVPDDYDINAAARHEPKVALFGGADGLDLYRKLFDQLHNNPGQVLYILCESLPAQHKQLQQIAAKEGYRLTAVDDFIQVFKLTV